MRKLLFVLPLIGVVASGCASVQAKSNSADRPALNVPPPPPRIIEPGEVIDPVSELPSSPSVTPPARQGRPVSREVPPKLPGTESKPEAKADPPVDPAPAPAAQLRTPQTADTSGAAKSVRTTIDTARGILNGVNFAPLSNERKKAYNEAKLFLQQAEDALRQGNLAFAQGVASKAETLARELAGRFDD